MSFFDRLRTIWANLHPFWRLLLALVLLAGGLFFCSGPAKSVYHRWKSANNLEQAKDALAASRFAEARELSFQVLRRDGQAFEPLPILLDSTAALGDPLGTRIAIALLQDPRSSAENQLAAWQHLCLAGPSYFPLSAWPALPDDKKSSLAYQLPFIDRLIGDQMISTAAAIIASNPEPFPIELQARLLNLLAQTKTDEAYDEFHRSFARFMREDPEHWTQLLETIDSIPQRELQRDIFDALPESATATTPDEAAIALRIARSRMIAEPAAAESIFAETFARYRTAQPSLLAEWCLQIGRPEQARQCLDLDLPAQDPADFRLQIKILEASAATDQLDEWLAEPPPAIPEWEPLIHRAAIARDQGNADLAAQLGRSALKSAAEKTDARNLIELAHEAQARKLEDLAVDAWAQAMARGTGPLPPAQSLSFVIQQLSNQQREDELFNVLDSLRFIEIGNPVISVQHLYLACLTGRSDPAAVVPKLQELQERYPEELAIRCSLALAYILAGEDAKAAKLLDNTGIDWFATNPAYRAIRGITLAKSDRTSEAEIYFENFPWDQLLPSEKRVFESLAESEP